MRFDRHSKVRDKHTSARFDRHTKARVNETHLRGSSFPWNALPLID